MLVKAEPKDFVLTPHDSALASGSLKRPLSAALKEERADKFDEHAGNLESQSKRPRRRAFLRAQEVVASAIQPIDLDGSLDDSVPRSQLEDAKDSLGASYSTFPISGSTAMQGRQSKCQKIAQVYFGGGNTTAGRLLFDGVVVPRLARAVLDRYKRIGEIRAEGPLGSSQGVGRRSVKGEDVELEAALAGSSSVAQGIREETPEIDLSAEAVRSEFQQNKKKWVNPKKKLKSERTAVSLNDDIIMSRLTAASIPFTLFPTSIAPALRDVMVSRNFMSTFFGGSSQETFPTVSAQKQRDNAHNYNDFMYLPDDYQPAAPQVPGAPGLWLNISDDGGSWDGEVRRLFTRITIGPALWLYQGQYEIRWAAPLTREEWCSLKPVVRNTWASQICRKGWGEGTLKSIYNRKHYGGDATKEEWDVVESQRLYKSITEEEVQGALTRGEEKRHVYTLRCIAYDVDFQTSVAHRHATTNAAAAAAPGVVIGAAVKSEE